MVEAAVRELEEETGVRGRPLGIVHVHELVAEGPGGATHYVIIDVLVDPEPGAAPRAASDALEARFFPLSELDASMLTPGAREIVGILPRLLGGCRLQPRRTVCLGWVEEGG